VNVATRQRPEEGKRGVRTRAWLWFAGSSAALAAGLGANVTADAATWFGVRGPHCPLGACLGPLACPGCGLVRATAATLQGDVALAWLVHPAGIAIAALLAATCALQLHILRRGCETANHRRLARAGHVAFTAALTLGWLLRLLLHRT
jgi:hypothetical protein